MPEFADRPVLLVDDGLASGVTMQAALAAVRAGGAQANRVIIATPTGHLRAVATMAGAAGRVCCPNIRSGFSFAVADAYRNWRDLSDNEVTAMLDYFRKR